jgi:hypothetical protein
MGRVDRVVAVNCTGVIVRFWINDRVDTSEMVMTSASIDTSTVLEAVAGLPTALAVIVAGPTDRRASGVPTSRTRFDVTETRERPVPSKLDVLNVTGRLDAEEAWNSIGDE